MRTLAALLVAFVLTLAARAQQKEPWLKAGDVVALVGGEDMVALAEEGWLETLVTWAQPQDRIRFRSLAWEGDTVFEQRRDLNYPAIETQLDRMGATVVLCQFGKMESFAGKEGVAAFTEAYGKLLERLNLHGKRRVSIVLPTRFGSARPPLGVSWRVPRNGDTEHIDPLLRPEKPLLLPDFKVQDASLLIYSDAIRSLAVKHGGRVFNMEAPPSHISWLVYDIGWGFHIVPARQRVPLYYTNKIYSTRDGIHLDPFSHLCFAATLLEENLSVERSVPEGGSPIDPLRAAIAAKNRLWFHYTRPQNWAFLAGNRTNQPSSRDHLDPTKRWFPEEMEEWLPLIEAKEQEIWKLAAVPR